MSSDSLEHNKQVVATIDSLFQRTDGDLNFDIVDELVSEDYIQHNPHLTQGREGLKEFLKQIYPIPEEFDASHIISSTMIAEGEYVVRQEIRDHGMLIDTYRFENGLAVEHWDAFRPNPGHERMPWF